MKGDTVHRQFIREKLQKHIISSNISFLYVFACTSAIREAINEKSLFTIFLQNMMSPHQFVSLMILPLLLSVFALVSCVMARLPDNQVLHIEKVFNR